MNYLFTNQAKPGSENQKRDPWSVKFITMCASANKKTQGFIYRDNLRRRGGAGEAAEKSYGSGMGNRRGVEGGERKKPRKRALANQRRSTTDNSISFALPSSYKTKLLPPVMPKQSVTQEAEENEAPAGVGSRTFLALPVAKNLWFLLQFLARYGSVAQLVERGIHKPKVPGSSPGAATSKLSGTEAQRH